MIPASFGYQRPATLEAALAALAASHGSAKVLAGGMSLLPLMKLRLASPETLIDIGRLAELKGSGPLPDGGYQIGALATYADVLETTQLDFARDAILGIGDVQVRNRGTVGGAIAHADPASDLPALALALDYSVVLRSARGERVVPVDGFFEGPFQTAIAADEILVSMRRGPLPAGAGGAYRKLAQPASGYSVVGWPRSSPRAAGRSAMPGWRSPASARSPYRATAVEAALVGSDGSAAAVAAAAAHATDGVTVNSDIHADREYRTRMAEVYTRRAIEAALGRPA